MNKMTMEIFTEAYNAGLEHSKALNQGNVHNGVKLFDCNMRRWGAAEAIGRKKVLAKYGITYAEFKEFRKTLKK